MRQRISITQRALNNLIFQPTRRSRNKPQLIPTESQVNTFRYLDMLRSAVADRMRLTR